ncbi:four-carbon acid sugar kinase family protein [Arthrobacter sp. H5]|uniref:four-carbon acid sugar kinase family protein n=1 Tax=Arthrobacter sp. H5 TaxID=1267973 RepID=UPI000480D0E3|nr:four-carbon acid sugar kinase family protein [Arthrobacter sp. H5]
MRTPIASSAVIGIAADDLTGANDTLVQFAEAGWVSRLSLGGHALEPVSGPTAVAAVTDARSLGAEAARTHTSDAVVRLIADGTDRLYVKIDSTMRGSVANQIGGALSAWTLRYPGSFAVVCPAYPAMGRTVEAGRLLVNGAPVESSAAGRDPVTPVLTSRMQDLLQGSSSIDLSTIQPGRRTAELIAAAQIGNGTVVVDASTDTNLEVLAEVLNDVGQRAVPVGSAGLAGALARRWGASVGVSPRTATNTAAPSGRTLVVVSSLHDVAREQSNRLVSALPAVSLAALQPTMQDLTDVVSAAQWLEHTLNQWGELPQALLLLSPVHSALGSSGARAGAEIANRLAGLATAIMDRSTISHLVLVGGDGARAVLRACDATSILVHGALREGVPQGVIRGGRANGVSVVTKAGGFGHPESLVEIISAVQTQTQLPTEARP